MRQPSKNESSDLHTILQNIESLLIWMDRSVNSVSRQLIRMAVAVECMTLSFKLEQLYQRWRVYLPFHECKDVKFDKSIELFADYHARLDSIDCRQSNLSELGFYPDAPFCLDLSCLLDDSIDIFSPRYASSRLSIDVEEYLERFDEQLERIRGLNDDETRDWRERIDTEAIDNLRQQYIDYMRYMNRSPQQDEDDRLDEASSIHDKMQDEGDWLTNINNYFDAISNPYPLNHCLDMALSQLLANLRQIDQLLNGDINSEQYLRLSLRLYHSYCPEAREQAQRDVKHWRAEWPLRKLSDRVLERRSQIISGMNQRYDKLLLDEYIDMENPAPLTDPEFGKFLFTNRKALTKKEVKELFVDCFHIHYLNSVIDPSTSSESKTVTRLGQERLRVYVRLKELISQANWKNGVKTNDVIACMEILLNIRPDNLPISQRPYTEEDTQLLWDMLTKRRNCQEGLRSLKITWLNLVGYFISRGALIGSGRNLCYEFFPSNTDEGRGNDKDYNAISKGVRDEAFKGFNRITAALDMMLKLKKR